MRERLQKIISKAGHASRRHAEKLIMEGRVKVNGVVVTNLGFKADPRKDHIRVNGKPIGKFQPKAYLLLNKPRGCVTTLDDPLGRPTVSSMTPSLSQSIISIVLLSMERKLMLLLRFELAGSSWLTQ